MAPRRRSLHWWISASLILLGLLMAAALTLQSLRSQQLVEHRIWRQLLESVAAGHAEQRALHADAPLPRHGILRTWYVEGTTAAPGMPDYLARLAPGYYSTEGGEGEFATDDRFHALVSPSGRGRLVTTVDIGDLERQQNHDALFNVLWAGVLVAAIAGLIAWLHANLVRPVRDLAARMRAIDPQVRGARLPLDYRQEEIHAIAQASNAHLERVERFIEREKSLLDQASHEFRTPVAVISGAVDVLRQQGLPERAQPVLDRIAGTVGHLSEIMVALLYLAREAGRTQAADATALHLLLPQLLRDHEHLLAHKRVEFRQGTMQPTWIAAPEAMVRIAVGNLVRNAVENTCEGHVEVALEGGAVAIRDSGGGFDAEQAARRYRDSLRAAAPAQGQGLGLFLVGRICDRFGWRLDIDSMPLDGTLASLDVGASVIAGPVAVADPG
ncbi:HAMP domain-containing sensor histidine kinase [Pseudoxanthomonas sp.]|uniref:sensor histidine kinase n=1 Tax=Pseudoxanthomonas sp. TaxID=1871049 RepID=UPI00258E5860|nr:HAMP domain-containing sensor histidine kinase [Pseudoxanthomonas sp.]MCR6684905.1 HAMP domain-containing histidine kinase [Pseudoxanthomonas sp.]